jgi:hypothetical protein
LSCLIIYTIQIEKKKTHIQLLENNKKAKQDSQVHDTKENFVIAEHIKFQNLGKPCSAIACQQAS